MKNLDEISLLYSEFFQKAEQQLDEPIKNLLQRYSEFSETCSQISNQNKLQIVRNGTDNSSVEDFS
jgi:hypothetical protein